MTQFQTAGRAGIAVSSRRPTNHEWRCKSCNRLLGLVEDGQLHVRFARSHEYLTALPATCTCRSCGTLNRVSPAA